MKNRFHPAGHPPPLKKIDVKRLGQEIIGEAVKRRGPLIPDAFARGARIRKKGKP